MTPGISASAPDQKRPEAKQGYDFSTELAFTEAYRCYQHAPPALREAMCLQVQ